GGVVVAVFLEAVFGSHEDGFSVANAVERAFACGVLAQIQHIHVAILSLIVYGAYNRRLTYLVSLQKMSQAMTAKPAQQPVSEQDRKSTRLNSSHVKIS